MRPVKLPPDVRLSSGRRVVHLRVNDGTRRYTLAQSATVPHELTEEEVDEYLELMPESGPVVIRVEE